MKVHTLGKLDKQSNEWHVLARFVIDDGCPAWRPIAFLLKIIKNDTSTVSRSIATNLHTNNLLDLTHDGCHRPMVHRPAMRPPNQARNA